MDSVNYHPGPIDESLLTQQSEHRSQLHWDGQDLVDLRLRVNFNKYWDTVREYPPPPEIHAVISSSGFDGVYQIGALTHDRGLITAFVERWRPETHTFHFRFGETTITLEDVYHILGLPTGGAPVIHTFVEHSIAEQCRMYGEVLGVYPTTEELNRNGLKIRWLVDHFASCERLDMDSDDYEMELLFHTRAHMLLIIGSVFPHSSGNRIPFQFLHYVRDHTQIHTYSWGSAALAYLYRGMCSASIGDKADICGCMTLLQVWIWERFPSLAPSPRDDVYMDFPLSMRWKVRLSMISVPRSQARIFRYELDCMGTDDYILWRPYRGISSRLLPSVVERRRWSSRCPLICNEIVEWCYTDRVTRQFGFQQAIPRLSPEDNHQRLHNTVNARVDWLFIRGDYIQLWESRLSQSLSPGHYRAITEGVLGVTPDYQTWYDSVTRRFILHPRHWSGQQGFQGSHHYSQYYVEGISQAYHAIDPSDPHVDEARTILSQRMTSTGYDRYRHTLPPQAPALDRGHRGTRRHTATGRPRGRPKDVHVDPEPGTYYDHVTRGPGSSDVPRSPVASPTHSVGGWGAWTGGPSYHQSQMGDDGGWRGTTEGTSSGSGWDAFIQTHDPVQTQTEAADWDSWIQDSSASFGGWGTQTHDPVQSQAEGDTYSSPIQSQMGGSGWNVGGSQLESHVPQPASSHGYDTPVRGFADFASQSNAFSSPESGGRRTHDDEVQQRQQPGRRVKGRGRRCFTGSHIL